MKINKNELKQSAVSQIPDAFRGATLASEKRLARRIETIIRASINHLSYELCFEELDGKPSIFLRKDDRIIIIERNPDTRKGPSTCHFGPIGSYHPLYRVCEFAYLNAQNIMTQVKGNLAKETADTNELKTVCAH